MLGAINKILKHSSVDGQGNRLVIFFQGCNFRCSYCHNPETINVCNNCNDCVTECRHNALQVLNGKVVWQSDNCIDCERCVQRCSYFSSPKVLYLSVSQVLAEVEKVRGFISGVTISGGECTQQYTFLKTLLIGLKELNISAFIDINAYLEHEKMQELSLYFDKVMPDVKAINTDDHLNLTGKSSGIVLRNIEYLLQKNKVHEIRTVIYPSLNNKQTIDYVSKLIATISPQVVYKLIKYNKSGVGNANEIILPTDAEMQELKQLAEENGCVNVVVT